MSLIKLNTELEELQQEIMAASEIDKAQQKRKEE